MKRKERAERGIKGSRRRPIQKPLRAKGVEEGVKGK